MITSRIHCALPCLALGTPVYFVHAGYHTLEEGLDDRFEGILDLFDVIDEKRIKFSTTSFLDRVARKLRLYEIFNKNLVAIDWDRLPVIPSDRVAEYAKMQKEIIS